MQTCDFSKSQAGGVFAGKFRVEITASRRSAKKVHMHTHLGDFFDYVDEQYLPARYNTQSELVVEVKPDGPNQFTYELTSRSKCARTDHRLYFNNTASLTVCWSVRFSGRLNRHQRE